MFSKPTKFESLLEAVPEALLGMDQTGTIRFVNHQTERLFGYDRDGLVGQHIETLVPKTLWPVYAEHREGYFADPRTRSTGLELELSGRRRDDSRFPVNITLSQIDTGDVLLAITAVSDVTSQRQAVENAGRIAAILEYSSDAIIGSTLDGIITSWNRAAERMFGFPAAETVGRSVALLSPKDRASERTAILVRIRAGHAVEDFQTMRLRKDGTEFPVSLTIAPIRDENGEVAGVSTIACEMAEQGKASENARLMTAIVEQSNDAIYGVTLEGIITAWNPAAERMYGYSREAVIGRSIHLVSPPDRTAEIDSTLDKLSDGQPVEHLDTIRFRRDGRRFPVSLTVSPIRDENGKVVGAFSIARDMTDRKQEFEAAQRTAAIVESSDDAIIGATPEGVITTWNPAAEKMFGYSGEEILGRSGKVLVPEDRPQEADEILGRVAAGEHVQHDTAMRIRKDGTAIVVSDTISPIRDEHGAITGVSAILRDVTELRGAAEYARSLIESSLDSMVAISPEGKITDANQATVKLTGSPREELIGTDFSSYFTEPEKAHEVYQRVFTEGMVMDHPLRLRHHDGHETLTEVLYNASAYRDSTGHVLGVFAAARDVTEQRQAMAMAEAERAHLRATVDSLLDPHLLLEAFRAEESGQIVDFMIVNANPVACAYSGLDYQDVVGARFLDLYPNHLSTGLFERYRQVVETGEPLVLDEVIYTHDILSSECRFDIRGARVADGMSLTFRDVTDRHVAAEKLAASEEQYRLLAENSSDVIMGISLTRKYEWVSGSVAGVLGWRAPELVGHGVDEYVHPDDLAWFRKVVANAGPGGTASVEFRFRRSDDTYRWVAWRTRVKVDEDGAPVAMVGGMVDIADRKAAEAREQGRLAELEQFHQLTVGREIKMIELKKEIEYLRRLLPAAGGE